MIRTVIVIALLLFNDNTFAYDNNGNNLPILYISGNFGYDYQEGIVTLVMPDGTKKENMASRIKWRGGLFLLITVIHIISLT